MEAAPKLGGLASAWQVGGVTWDRFYHVILPSDTALLRFVREIGLGDVVRQLEPSLALVECFGTRSHCLLDPACRLKGALAGALQAFFAALDRLTLADLIGDDGQLHAVLGIPQADAQAPRPTIEIRLGTRAD